MSVNNNKVIHKLRAPSDKTLNRRTPLKTYCVSDAMDFLSFGFFARLCKHETSAWSGIIVSPEIIYFANVRTARLDPLSIFRVSSRHSIRLVHILIVSSFRSIDRTGCYALIFNIIEWPRIFSQTHQFCEWWLLDSARNFSFGTRPDLQMHDSILLYNIVCLCKTNTKIVNTSRSKRTSCLATIPKTMAEPIQLSVFIRTMRCTHVVVAKEFQPKKYGDTGHKHNVCTDTDSSSPRLSLFLFPLFLPLFLSHAHRHSHSIHKNHLLETCLIAKCCCLQTHHFVEAQAWHVATGVDANGSGTNDVRHQ